MSKKPKVVVLGLDCLTPQLLFDQWLDQLPTFKKLVETGTWGKLKSVDPPITVPAWSCMMSGYNPAQLGIYGFRHRVVGTYDELYFARSNKVSVPRVWDYLGDAGLSSGIMGVPQTFPVRKMKGWLVSGFLAPSVNSVFTFPDKMREELHKAAGEGGYMLDVENFRSDDRDRILADIFEMTRRRWKAFRYMIENKGQDFMMVVEMGSDRIHHAFWRYTDPEHPKFEPGNPFEHSVREYYEALDKEIADTLALLDDDTEVYVVSDHGARSMVGGFCINDWLREKGLLKLKEEPTDGQTKFSEKMVDWEHTKVWAWGGYYARIFVNVQGREPNGQVPAESLEDFKASLRQMLEEALDPDGANMDNVVFEPSDIAPEGQAPKGDMPDLMVYFGNLKYRSIGSVGNDTLFVEGNDTGPDDANHDHYGIFIHGTVGNFRNGVAGPGEREGLQLVDIGPTIVKTYGIEPPADSAGKPMELG